LQAIHYRANNRLAGMGVGDVRFSALNGLNSDIMPFPLCQQRTFMTPCCGSGTMAEHTELERLLRTPRRHMDMRSRTNELERMSKGLAKAHGVVPYYSKTTALFRTIEREGCNDGMPSSPQGPPKARDICRTVMVLGEKVESRPIMPDIVSLQWFPSYGVR
jgi:hypothetical protein